MDVLIALLWSHV